jgi:Ku protein
MASTVLTSTLSFGLVSAPVRLKKVSESKATELKTASPEGNPLARVYLDGVTGEVVENGDLRKGLFEADGFHEISQDALTAIDEATKLEVIEVTGFIPLADVPFERAISAYFLAPGGKGGPIAAKPLALLRDTLRKYKVAGFGKVTLRTKSYPFVVYEHEGGLLVNTLVWADEFQQVHEAAESLEGVQTPKATVELAGQLVKALTTTVADLDALKDDRREKREKLIAAALAGKPVTSVPTAVLQADTTDLEAALAASLAASEKKRAKVKV